jgi:hypothetical protein
MTCSDSPGGSSCFLAKLGLDVAASGRDLIRQIRNESGFPNPALNWVFIEHTRMAYTKFRKLVYGYDKLGTYTRSIPYPRCSGCVESRDHTLRLLCDHRYITTTRSIPHSSFAAISAPKPLLIPSCPHPSRNLRK